MCFLSYFNQWPSDLPMESYIFFCRLLIREKHCFSKTNAYINILNQSNIDIISSNTFSSTDRILCVFSLIFKYQEKCLFHLIFFQWKLLKLMKPWQHCHCFLIMFFLVCPISFKHSYPWMEFFVYFRSILNNRKHVSVL